MKELSTWNRGTKRNAFCFLKVNFTTTLFALIRENLKINVRESSEMDQADIELRTTIIKCWPHTKRDKIDLLVPTPKSKSLEYSRIGQAIHDYRILNKQCDFN